jgi:Tol biopolymer transport system component
MRIFIPGLLFLFVSSLAAAQPPATDIFVFDLDVNKDKITIRNPKNITARPGYDNQPFFHPEKSVLYFVSADTQKHGRIFLSTI